MKPGDFSRAPFPKYITFPQMICAGGQHYKLKLAFSQMMMCVKSQYEIITTIKEAGRGVTPL